MLGLSLSSIQGLWTHEEKNNAVECCEDSLPAWFLCMWALGYEKGLISYLSGIHKRLYQSMFQWLSVSLMHIYMYVTILFVNSYGQMNYLNSTNGMQRPPFKNFLNSIFQSFYHKCHCLLMLQNRKWHLWIKLWEIRLAKLSGLWRLVLINQNECFNIREISNKKLHWCHLALIPLVQKRASVERWAVQNSRQWL